METKESKMKNKLILQGSNISGNNDKYRRKERNMNFTQHQ